MTRSSPQYISQAKQLLDVHCDQGTSWSNTQCYRKPEITQNCETMIAELNIGNYNYYSASIPRFVCEKYQRFRHCVHNIVVSACTPIEREVFFSYLYDKVQEIAWKCANDTMFFDNYDRYHPMLNGGRVYTNSLAQPPYTYGGVINNPNQNNFGYNRFNYYDRNFINSNIDEERGNRPYGYGYGNSKHN